MARCAEALAPKKPAKPEQPDKFGKPEKLEKPEQPEKPEKPEEAEKSGQNSGSKTRTKEGAMSDKPNKNKTSGTKKAGTDSTRDVNSSSDEEEWGSEARPECAIPATE